MLQDLQYAIRTLSKRPGFTFVAVITLALGIGATTGMFSVIDGVLLKPLRYRDANRIVAVVSYFPERGKTHSLLTGPDYIEVRDTSGVFEAIGYQFGAEMGLRVGNRAEFVPIGVVTPDVLKVFGVTPAAGRLFNRDDEGQSALLSVPFAVRNFGGVENALNQSVIFENKPHRVVGILPASFNFPDKSEVWLAWKSQPDVLSRTAYNYRPVAKLAPGVTVEAANARLASIAAGLAKQFPDSNKDHTLRVVPLRDRMVVNVRTTLLFLLGAVGLVLLIACANVANLLLARATGRTQEMAVRSALGARQGRIIRQLLVESGVLGLAAAALGIVIAEIATQFLLMRGAESIALPRLSDISIDWRVLLFAVGVSLIASVGFGLVPALNAAKVNLYDALKQKGSGGLAGQSTRLRSALVVSQIALSFVLVVGAALLFRSFLAMTSVDLGFRTEGILVMQAHDPASTKKEYMRVVDLQPQILDRLRQVPGVVSAGAAMGMPMGQYGVNGGYVIQGVSDFDTGKQLPNADTQLASPGYFATMGIPLLRGRDFLASDTYDLLNNTYPQEPVAIISESVARQSFANQDPIGQHIKCGFDNESFKTWMTVVGVVGDVRQDSPADPPSAGIYMPLAQHPYRANEYQIVIRTSVPPATLIAPVQEAVRQLNPEIATKFMTLNDVVNDAVAAPRFRMTLASAFAGLALLLAIFGVYSVMSYVTAQRTPEFALRAALGARPSEIARLVLGRTAKLAALGVFAGAGLSLAASRILTSMLFGLKSTDALTYAVVLATVVPLVVLAAALPALRAARVDPMHALRYE